MEGSCRFWHSLNHDALRYVEACKKSACPTVEQIAFFTPYLADPSPSIERLELDNGLLPGEILVLSILLTFSYRPMETSRPT